MPERTLDDIKTDLAFRLAERNPDAIEYNVTQEWDTDIETLVGWIDQHIYANQMDAEQRVRTAGRLAELTEQVETQEVFNEHLWHRIMRQMDLLEERDARIEQLEAEIKTEEAVFAAARERLQDRWDEIQRLRRGLDYFRRSAQAAIDDSHSSDALFAVPVRDKAEEILAINATEDERA